MVSKEMSKKDYAVLTRARRFIESAAERLSFSGSPTQLTKEAAYRRVRCKRSLGAEVTATLGVPPSLYDAVTPYIVGLMFGLRRKKLSGSYFFFSAANRS